LIKLENLTLEYELFRDKTNNLKEALINLVSRKSKKGQNKYYRALNQLNLTFQDGERIGIIGKNGAGKSTLLKVISGILKPTEGELTVEGNVQPLIELGAGFDIEISGRENVYLNGYMLGFTKAQIKEKEQAIIDFADIGSYIDIPVKYYSSGMLVRLAFTIATSIHPEILIIDEMLGAGDIHFIKKAEKRISELIEQARIVIIVSHDLDFIERICPRTVLLEQGRVAFDGNTQQAVEKFRSEVPGET
jgi:ABC-type polysaccharide/polyol phosphate transport system ATPase subunit